MVLNDKYIIILGFKYADIAVDNNGRYADNRRLLFPIFTGNHEPASATNS